MIQANSLVVPEVDPGIRIAQAGFDIGKMDLRFGGPEQVRQSRSVIRDAVGLSIDDSIYVIVPSGSTDFVDIENGTEPEKIQASDTQRETEVIADGLITRRPRVGLMLNAADCIPLVVFDSERDILSLIHVGWRGAVNQFPEKILGYARENYGFNAGDSVAYLGPTVGQESYRAEELHEAQTGEDWKPHIKEGDDGFYIDLQGFVSAELLREGIKPENIHAFPTDTAESYSGHYSFTRHKNEGVPNGRNGFVTVMA
jgi:copper oxidase (laccase) domain-containing protein